MKYKIGDELMLKDKEFHCPVVITHIEDPSFDNMPYLVRSLVEVTIQDSLFYLQKYPASENELRPITKLEKVMK